MIKGRLYLYGKPNERLIAIGLCHKYECEYGYDTSTGYFHYEGINASEMRQAYNAIIAVAYKALAFAQARTDLNNVPIKTLNTEFMQAFAAMTYSISTGEPFMFKVDTEAQRAGLKAVGKTHA